METESIFLSRDRKDINKHFQSLWKIDTLNKLLKLDCSGTITRNYQKDLERTLELIKYGFEEGLKYMEPKWKKKADKFFSGKDKTEEIA